MDILDGKVLHKEDVEFIEVWKGITDKEMTLEIFKEWKWSKLSCLCDNSWISESPKIDLWKNTLVTIFFHKMFNEKDSKHIPWWRITLALKDLRPDDLEVLYLLFISSLVLEEQAASGIHRLTMAGLCYPLAARDVPHAACISDYNSLTEDGVVVASLIKAYGLITV